MLSSFLDDELDPAVSRDVSRHLETCPDCAAALDRLRRIGAAVREDVEYHRAPDLLRARVLRDVRAAARPSRRAARAPWRWAAVAATVVMVAGGVWLAALAPFTATRDAVARDAVAGHVRSLMAAHLMDVASTDQHTVKPWFAGRLDFSPPVHDFAAAGYPLVGGRLDYLQGRPVAALVYERRKHVINVFVWPAARGLAASTVTRQGYNVIQDARGGMAVCVVSDLNRDELGTFARGFVAAIPAGN